MKGRIHRLRTLCAVAIISALSFQIIPSRAATGDLDTTFAGTGKVRIGFGGGYAIANASAVQAADGKLILAGFGSTGAPPYSPEYFLLARFTTSNTLDASFGSGGKVITPLGVNNSLGVQEAVIQSVQVQADGRILAAGYSFQSNNYNDFTLVRYNSDGSLDTTFGANGTGIVYTDLGQQAQINALAIEADGKIVADGYLGYPGANNAGIALARYKTNGVLDTAFGAAGIIATPGNEYDALYGLLIEPDQKILATGSADVGFAVYRFTTNGATDTTLGGGTGHVYTSFGTGFKIASGKALAMQLSDGVLGDPDRFVAVGTYNNYNADPTLTYQILIRYIDSDGSLDTAFGTGGIVSNLLGNGIVSPAGLVVQGSIIQPFKMYVGGSYGDGTNLYFGYDRFTSAGALDTTFGTNSSGKAALSLGRVSNNVDAGAGSVGVDSGFLVAGYKGVLDAGYEFAAVRFTSTGTIDTNFGTNGLLLADVADTPAQANGVAIQPDGKVVTAGSVAFLANDSQFEHFLLARFNTDGSLDSSFGTNGSLTTTISSNDFAYAVALQPDGKIVAVGNSGGNFAVARYNTNGSPDPSFGSGGMVSTLVGTGSGVATALRIQPDGKIVAAGYADDSSSDQHFAVARFNTNGALDTTFGSGGKVTTSIETADEAYGVGIQTNGKIALAGLSANINGSTLTSDFGVARYSTNGALDLSFGSLGRTTANVGGGTLDVAYALAIQQDGKIIVAGGAGFGNLPGPIFDNASVNAFVALVRFNTNGTLDTSFGSGGTVITEVGAYSDFATSLALQPDGKIVVAGASQNTDYQFFALRYNTDGSVDDSYGTSGASIVNFGSGTNEIAYGLALDSFGRAVLAGSAGGLVGVARLLGDVSPVSLTISHSATNTILISWPYPSAGWNLQQNSNLITGGWVTPPETVNNDGTNNFIVVSPPTGTLFFRLEQ